MKGKLTIYRSDKTGIEFINPPVHEVGICFDKTDKRIVALKPGTNIVIDSIEEPLISMSAYGIHIDGIKYIGGTKGSYLRKVLYQRWYFRPEADNA